jgi:hypothetical protein
MIIAQYIIVIASITFLVAYPLRGKKRWQEVALAVAVSAAWVGFSGIYTYRDTNIAVLGFNLFPFFAWTAGLVLLKAVYDKLGSYKYLKSTLFYLSALLICEFVGYNLLGVQLSSNYPGLFGLSLMHAPWHSQLYYIFIGPIYLLALHLLGLINLNKKPVKK